MDVRRRISFNMNTGSGEPTTGGTYTVNLNSQWEKTTAVPNPDSTLYDGAYRSSSNYNVGNSASIMYIDISGYSEFTLYIRSYAESNYDYVMVSELDKTITSGSSYSDTTLVKAHTRGNQQSGTAISNYTEVNFTNIDGGSHRITVLYRKDSSVNSGDDRGYLLIKGGESSGTGGGGSEDGPGDVTGPINIDNYLTILALEDGLTASLSNNACQYCIDGDGNWINLPSGTTTQAINQGQTLSFKGNLTPNLSTGIGRFTINKKCNLEGNCMSMLFGDDVVNNNSLSGKNNAFYRLFYKCTTIRQVSYAFLPATTLASYCYDHMFEGCTSLTTVPSILPATTLSDHCYFAMFNGCTSLTTAPELPATTLAEGCYGYMFQNCSKLNYIKMLATDISASYCLYNWVKGVSSTGTFVKNRAMSSLSTGVDGIPSGWTGVDDVYSILYTSSDGNIVTPNRTDAFGSNIISNNYINGRGIISFNGLVTSIGAYAFRGCSSLTSITIPNSVTSIGESAFNHCSSLTSVTIGNSVTTIGAQAFYECDSLTSVTIPDSVTTIGDYAFEYCYSLTSVYCRATTPPSLGSFAFNHVPGLTIYVPEYYAEVYKKAYGWNKYASYII